MNDNPITIQLFKKMNSNNIAYCVLRNYVHLPSHTGSSDLDLWVKCSDYPRFMEILSEVCKECSAYLVSYKKDRLCPQFTLCACLFGLQIDMHIGIANHKGVAYFDEKIIANSIFDHNGIKVLAPEADGLMCFLKELLNNKQCKTEYCEKAHQAIATMSSIEAEQYLNAFSPTVRKKIINVLRCIDFREDVIRNLGVEASKDLQSFSSKLKHIWAQVMKIERFFHPLGYTIAFLGTDGSGKSTIINAVSSVLGQAFHKGVRYEHMRPNYLPSLAILTGKRSKDIPMEICTNPHGGKTSGFIGSLLRVSYYWLDYTYGYLCKVYFDKSVKNHVWIFDRYFYDYVNDPQRACIRLPQWLLKCYGLFVPKPDLIICLGTDPERIHARKPELPLVEVRRQVETLKVFAKNNKKAVWIDTGCSVEESVHYTMKAILNMMGNRFGNIKQL